MPIFVKYGPIAREIQERMDGVTGFREAQRGVPSPLAEFDAAYSPLIQPILAQPGIYMGEAAYEKFWQLVDDQASRSYFLASPAPKYPMLFGRSVHHSRYLPPDAVILIPAHPAMERLIGQKFRAQYEAMKAAERANLLEHDRIEQARRTIRYTIKEPHRWLKAALIGAIIATALSLWITGWPW